MKKFIKIFIVLAAVSFTQFAVARETLWAAKMASIKVTSVVPEIQEQLNKANPENRKILEAAIHTGNLFVPQHFSGNAYVASLENDDWLDDVSPLVMTNEKWIHEYGDGGASMQAKIMKDTYQYRLTCPQISLVSMQQDDRTTSLTYKAGRVGTLVYFHERDLYDFNSEGAGETYEVRFVLDNSDALVNKVIQQDKWQTEAYTSFLAYMNDFLGDHRVAHSTKKHVGELVANYQRTKHKIEKSAARFCR